MEPSTTVTSVDKIIKFMKIDLEALKDSQNKCVRSSPSQISKLSTAYYYISIYPNGTRDDSRGRACMFLFVKDENAVNIHVDADITLSVESANFQYKWINSETGQFLSTTTKEFFDSKFFSYGELNIKVKGTFKLAMPQRIRYPISATWKVKQSDLEALKTSTNGCLRSKRFCISSGSDAKCFFLIYPNGSAEVHRKQAMFCFKLGLPSGSKIEVFFSITIDTASFLRRICSTVGSYTGGFKICSTDDLFNSVNRYFVDGEMILRITGTVVIEKESIEPTILACENGAASKAYQRHQDKDFTIVVDGRNIKVHKKVLIESSPVFEAMFVSGMKEVAEKKIKLTDFGSDIVEAALKLLYSDSIPTNFSFEQMLSLLQFADKYDITIIKDLVQDYLAEKLSPTNVCTLINFTTTTVDAQKLLSKCKEYLFKCSKESKAIHDLDTVDKDLLLQIFMGTFTHIAQVDNS